MTKRNTKPTPENLISIELQYQLYLQRVNLLEDQMHEQQRIQLRRAFFGAAGQMLILMRDDISALPEVEGVQTLERLVAEVNDYWLKQVGQAN